MAFFLTQLGNDFFFITGNQFFCVSVHVRVGCHVAVDLRHADVSHHAVVCTFVVVADGHHSCNAADNGDAVHSLCHNGAGIYGDAKCEYKCCGGNAGTFHVFHTIAPLLF